MIIWFGIVGGIMIGPRKVSDGIRIATDTYIAFLRENLHLWLKTAKDHLQEKRYIYAR